MTTPNFRFTFNDHVTLRTVVYPSMGSRTLNSYRVMLPMPGTDAMHDISTTQHTSGQFAHDFEERDAEGVEKAIHEGRIVYLYDAHIPVEVHVLASSDNDPDNLCPLIDSILLIHGGPSVELRGALSQPDVERLLNRMELLINAYAKAQDQ